MKDANGATAQQTARAAHAADLASLPTGRASVHGGKLKDTPANRALHPVILDQGVFADQNLARSAYYADDHSLILNDDVKSGLQRLIDAKVKVNCIVTSPPYYGQRDYGVDGQYGLETDPQSFIDRLGEVFEMCWEVLEDNGSLWINIGDTYWSGKGAHKSSETKQSARRFGRRPQDAPGDGVWTRPKQLLLIPHRLAIALQDQGWIVRNDNVWVKPNPVPDQVRDRCSISHEYVFHLTKSRWYYFNRHAVGRPQPSGSVLPPIDTWSIPTATRPKTNHRASFSEELVRIPILATTPTNGVVLDPFNGTGTTMAFARQNGFRSIGIDLKEDYCAHAADRLKELDSQEVMREGDAS